MKNKLGSITTLGLLISSLALSACGKDEDPATVVSYQSAPVAANFDPNEPTPEELAQQLGVEPASTNRKVPASEFSKYPLVVDIFRSSADRPVLGAFDESYIDLLIPDRSIPAPERLKQAQKKFATLAAKELAVISVNGVVQKIQIISTGLEAVARGGFRTTPAGNYKLDAIAYQKRVTQPNGSKPLMLVLFPWLVSSTYNNSPMYWGLWLFGGYFMHSTSHYGELGRRASMGCIRQSFPDAIELFRLRQYYKGMARIHPIGSVQAVNRLRTLTPVETVIEALMEETQNIKDYIAYNRSTEVYGYGHTWIDSISRKPVAVNWPNCGPIDCFSIWGVRAPATRRVVAQPTELGQFLIAE